MKKYLIFTLSVVLSFISLSPLLAEAVDEDALIESMVDTQVWGNYPGYNNPSTPYWRNQNSPYYAPYGIYGYPWQLHKSEDKSPYPKDIKPAGRVLIRVEPIDAEVYMDGMRLNQMPDLSYQIALFAGKHNLSVMKKGYKDYSGEIIVPAGGGVVVPVVLEKK